MFVKFPKVGYEVRVYPIDDIYCCLECETFYSQREVSEFLKHYDKNLYHASVSLIGGVCTL